MTDITLLIGPVVGSTGAFVLGGETLVPLGTAVGAIYAIWQVANRINRWESKLDRHTETIKMLSDNSQSQHASMERMERLLITRPCLTAQACEEMKRIVKEKL